MKLDWIIKGKCNLKEDVSITYVSRTDKKDVCNITFRNLVNKKITKTQYIEVAIVGNRMYFRETNEKLGFKISKKQDGINGYCSIRDRRALEFAKYNSGEFNILYDKENELFYIENDD